MHTTFVVFKDSKASFLSDLDRNAIKYQPIEAFSSAIMASGTLISITQSVVSSTAFAAIVVAWIKYRSSRKIIITTKENNVVHLEGYSVKDVEKILSIAERVAVIDTEPQEAQHPSSKNSS